MERKEQRKRYVIKALEGASADTVRRYGGATKEHLVALNGVDREVSSKPIAKRWLKSIADSKVNKKFEYSNIKQQAGFSAEVKTVARQNAEQAIKDSKERFIRTDDMSKQQAENGTFIGGTNDQLYDVAQTDASGVYIQGTASQLKYVGKDGIDCANKILSKDFDKYLNNNVTIEIPSDYFDTVVDELNDKADKLQKEILNLEKSGNINKFNEKKEQLDRVNKTKANLKKGKLTSKEAIEARLKPSLSTAKDIGKVAHRAGIEQAKTGAIICGSVSIIKNFVACAKEEITPTEAAKEVLKDTGTGAIFSYATAFTGSVAKGVMQNSSSQVLRGLSKTNFAAGLVTTTTDIGKTIARCIKGELTPSQCIEELGERGFGQLGSMMYASFGVLAVKGSGSALLKITAGMTGSMVGYAAATAVYKELSTALKEYELAVEERKQIEAECQESIKLICQYREEMNVAVNTFMKEHLDTISFGFNAMDKSIMENDVDGFIAGNAVIQKKLGHCVRFSNQDEFDALMMSDEDFKF